MMSFLLKRVSVALLLAMAATAVSAQDMRAYSKKAAFEDVKFDLTNAIVAGGFTIDYNGQIGSMLERTGADVGSTKPIYKHAEFFTFCSAKLSRQMMEADLANIGFCPYVIFIYEAADKPGVTVVGYRRPTPSGNDASRKALAAVDTLLDGLVKEAVK